MRPIRLQETFRAVFYVPFYAALARGDYAAQGVDVTLLDGGEPARAKDAVLEGRAEIAWGGPMRLMLAHDADPACPLRNFGAAVLGDPFFLVGRGPRTEFRLRELAGLRFASVAEVPTPWWALQEDIRQDGLDPDALNRDATHTMAENSAALLRGDVDVIQVFEPFVSRLEDAGCAVWHAAATRGPTAYTTFMSTTANLREYAPEFRAMLRGLGHTLDWLHATPDAEVAHTVAPFFVDLDAAMIARCITRYRPLGIWPRTPFFPPEPWERLEHATFTAGAIRRKPGHAACVDNTLLD
ncbi:MAG: ABC transporter substrate-binding protein [Alphaproteobacteria bacterium]|nr:ABC transporter substrate-binding protein [Alphaproteobacteria bacterium]